MNQPTWRKPCDRCGTLVSRFRGQTEVSCLKCGAWYNAAGQSLRDNWQSNASNYDDEVSDLEGMEQAEARAETYESDHLDALYFEPEYRDE